MTLCKHGHDYNVEGVTRDGSCAECQRISSRDYSRRFRERAAEAGMTPGKYRMHLYRLRKGQM